MSRFLVTLWPFTGHLLPQVAIAQALRERGHEVAFYSGEAVRHHVEGQGFPFFAFDRLDQEVAFRTMRTVDTGDRSSRPGGGRLMPLMRDWLVETIPDQISDIRAVIDDGSPRRSPLTCRCGARSPCSPSSGRRRSRSPRPSWDR